MGSMDEEVPVANIIRRFTDVEVERDRLCGDRSRRQERRYRERSSCDDGTK